MKIRKNIDLSLEAVKGLTIQGLDNNQNVKNFIETQLEAMGAKGIPYLDLWHQCEAMSAQLKELSNLK